MATDRKIKSDAQIDIEATQVDIGANTNVTGNITATGTVTSTGDITSSGDVDGVNSTLSGNLNAVDGDFSGSVDVTGDVDAANATFTGNVSGVNGTYSGNLNAVNSTLSGNLGAVDGTFSGNVSVTGTINSFNFPSSDGTANQVLKTDGSGNLGFVDQSSGGSGSITTIASQTDANNYTLTVGDTIVITASEDISFSQTLSNVTIYCHFNDNLTLSAVYRSSIYGAIGQITVNTMSACKVVSSGEFIFKSTSIAKDLKNSIIRCTNFKFNFSSGGILRVERASIFCDTVGVTASSGENKIYLNLGTQIYTRGISVDSTSTNIKVNSNAYIKATNYIYAKLVEHNTTTVIFEKALTSSLPAVPMEIHGHNFKIDVPVAGRYNISSDVTVDTSSNSTYDVLWNTVDQQTGGLSLSSNKVKIPYDGWYQITAGIYVDAITNSNNNASIRWRISVDGTSRVFNQESQIDTNTQDVVQDSASLLYYCQKDELIGVYIQEISDATDTIVVSGSNDATFLSIHMVK